MQSKVAKNQTKSTGIKVFNNLSELALRYKKIEFNIYEIYQRSR